MMVGITWFNVLIALLNPAFYIAALIYAIRQPDDGTPARRRAITGLLMILAIQLAGFLVPWALFQAFPPDRVVPLMLGWSLLTNVASFFAHAMLISAVFVGRGRSSMNTGDALPSWSEGQRSNDNPYQPPMR